MGPTVPVLRNEQPDQGVEALQRITRESVRQLRRPTSSGHASSNVRFSPYVIPQRSGRSVSPLPTPNGILGSNGMVFGAESDQDDEELDFWGRDLRGGTNPRDNEDEEWMDESDEEMNDELDEGEEGDEDDDMELFGHR